MALHHIGFVVGSIEKIVDRFARSISAQWDGQIIADPLQGVRVTFLRSVASPSESLIELVEPAGAKSPVQNFLKRGGGLHHLCYEVDSLTAQLQLSRSLGGLVVRQPNAGRCLRRASDSLGLHCGQAPCRVPRAQLIAREASANC